MKKFNNLPLYDIIIGDEEFEGCSKISLVAMPAVETAYLMFNENTKELKFALNDEKHILTGVAMRANYPIYRRDENKEYYVQFTPEYIEKMANKFFKEQKGFNISINHSTDVQDCYVVESYILNKNRGIVPVEFADIEDGSWIVSVKIDNEQLWQDLKSGPMTAGFSIEVAGELMSVETKDENKTDWTAQIFN